MYYRRGEVVYESTRGIDPQICGKESPLSLKREVYPVNDVVCDQDGDGVTQTNQTDSYSERQKTSTGVHSDTVSVCDFEHSTQPILLPRGQHGAHSGHLLYHTQSFSSQTWFVKSESRR